MHGGELVAEVLAAQGVPFLFTLCGGHISPILVAAKARGMRVIDTRHEATAVFAADAVARLTGRPGVAAVTAGPGVTNTITAVKNAQMAQSPVVLIGGAAPTLLQGRGALQDIDQMALMHSLVKWSSRVQRVRDLVPNLEMAFREAQDGIPGPVFVEIPVDLLYPEAVVRPWYGLKGRPRSIGAAFLALYMRRHVQRLFSGADRVRIGPRLDPTPAPPDAGKIHEAARRLLRAQRPVILVGSQATLQANNVGAIAAALTGIGAPVYLSGMARGLLGRDHHLQMRHQRRTALKEADLVILAGVPCDFRLDYGRQIGKACLISANRSATDLTKNRRPDLGILGDAGLFLGQLAAQMPAGERWPEWRATLRQRDAAREVEIDEQAQTETAQVNPLRLLQQLDQALPDNALIVADGGDFVGSASYLVGPRGPLTWLDPGAFGTLGVGAGFALGAKLVRPDAEVWTLFGDGAVGYSLSEFDTFVRHGVPIIAVVGNDGGWTQIAREQIELLGDDVGTALAQTAYHCVAEGFGAAGFLIDQADRISGTLQQARAAARTGRPVLINALLGKTDFRKGSISM